MRSVRILLCALVAIALTLTSYAAAPIQFSHQGILRDASDMPVTGTRSLTFHIYESEVGGSPVWSEVHPLVSIEQGLFNVTLGSVNALTSDVLSPAGSGLSADPIQRFLAVQVDADAPLTPRTRLVAAPYAVAARRIAGDIETGPGTIVISDAGAVLAQLAGDTDSVFLKLRLPTGNAQEGVLTTEMSRYTLSSDADADGVLESELSQIIRPTGANLAIKTKGTSAQRLGSNIGATRDSAGVRSGYDEDGDGINETEVTTIARKALGRMKCSDVTLERAYLSVVSADSSGSSLSLDSKLNPNAARDNFLQGAADILQARLQIGSDSDNDGVTDNSVEQRSTNDSAFVSIVSRFGSGPRQTTSMDGSFSHSSHRTASDVDGDGTPESSTESYSDATTARIQAVRATVNTGERAQLQADDSGPSLTLYRDDTARVLLSPDSGLVLRNGGAAVVIALSHLGTSGKLHVGSTAAPTNLIDVAGGAYCDGTNWVNASDANSKENFAKVDGRDILSKLDRLDITRWNYKGQAEAAHIGPTAQDFREMFGVGVDDKSISTIDPSGIALAAIKELNRQNQELREANELLLREILNIKKAVADLRTSQ